jgi:hypothetical protein
LLRAIPTPQPTSITEPGRGRSNREIRDTAGLMPFFVGLNFIQGQNDKLRASIVQAKIWSGAG